MGSLAPRATLAPPLLPAGLTALAQPQARALSSKDINDLLG
jgi:hypothetical protein